MPAPLLLGTNAHWIIDTSRRSPPGGVAQEARSASKGGTSHRLSRRSQQDGPGLRRGSGVAKRRQESRPAAERRASLHPLFLFFALGALREAPYPSYLLPRRSGRKSEILTPRSPLDS